MAMLMVHLLVAQRWAQAHPEFLNCPEYYLGAISPDAIHVRDHDDKSHKNEIHLNNWTSPHTDEVVKYWKKNDSAFDIGYGVHVLTDCQWVPRYHKRVPQLVLPDGRTDAETYYTDAFITDFELYRERGGLDLFGMVDRGEAPDNHPLLTYDELDQWRKWMVSSYRGECPRKGTVKYLDRAYMEEFVEDSIPMIEEVYQRFLHEAYHQCLAECCK